MRLTTSLLGGEWGHLAHVRGQVKYTISPHAIRPYNNIFNKLIPNTLRRIRAQSLYIGIPFMVGYYIFVSVEKAHDETLRKNPADYAGEK